MGLEQKGIVRVKAAIFEQKIAGVEPTQMEPALGAKEGGHR